MSIFMSRRGTMEASGVIVFDSFTRADSSSTMGNTETGQAWSPISSTWGISSNKAYEPSPGNGDAVFVNAGYSNVTFISDMLWEDAGDGVMFRALGSAANDGFLFYLHSNQSAQLLVPGFGTALFNVAQTVVAGTTYQMKVVLSGSSISCYVDGVLKGTVSNATQSTATRFGFRSGGTTAAKRWDNLRINRN